MSSGISTNQRTSPSSAPAIRWPTPGNTIDTEYGRHYLIGFQIDQGAYSLVFAATDLQTNDQVVLKVYKPAQRQFEEVRDQWQRECALCFKVTGHPNIVVVIDAFICDNLFYIVFERAWGNLATWIESIPKPIPDFAVLRLAHDVLTAMTHIHSCAIVHRDITIFNVLVFNGPSGAIFKVSDFGISKEFIDPWSEWVCSTQIAHPRFIPPELLLAELGGVTERSDLYHLGLVLLYAHTGELPLNDTMTSEEISSAIKAGVPRQRAEQLGTPLGRFISVLLRRRPKYRFKSAPHAYDALCDLHQFEPLVPPPAPWLSRT